MLERITNNLSNVYSDWKTRALALGAARGIAVEYCFLRILRKNRGGSV